MKIHYSVLSNHPQETNTNVQALKCCPSKKYTVTSRKHMSRKIRDLKGKIIRTVGGQDVCEYEIVDREYEKLHKLLVPYIKMSVIRSLGYADEDTISECHYQAWQLLRTYGPTPLDRPFSITLKARINNVVTNKYRMKKRHSQSFKFEPTTLTIKQRRQKAIVECIRCEGNGLYEKEICKCIRRDSKWREVELFELTKVQLAQFALKGCLCCRGKGLDESTLEICSCVKSLQYKCRPEYNSTQLDNSVKHSTAYKTSAEGIKPSDQKAFSIDVVNDDLLVILKIEKDEELDYVQRNLVGNSFKMMQAIRVDILTSEIQNSTKPCKCTKRKRRGDLTLSDLQLLSWGIRPGSTLFEKEQQHRLFTRTLNSMSKAERDVRACEKCNGLGFKSNKARINNGVTVSNLSKHFGWSYNRTQKHLDELKVTVAEILGN